MSRSLFSYKNNSLCFDETSLSDLSVVENYQDPVLIYKKSLIEERIQWVKSWSSLKQLHFAMKSNFSPTVLQIFLKNKCGLDVVSLGEIQAGLKQGFSPQDIIFSGVGKTSRELEWSIDHDIYQINIESISELKKIIQIAEKKNKTVHVGLRVNPLIDAGTHPYISTALKDSKFGIQLEDLKECLQLFKTTKKVQFKCLSFHIGSQILETNVFKQSIEKMKTLFLELKSEFSELDRFDVGGGLGIDYTSHASGEDLERWLSLKKIYESELNDFKADILCELGRFVVARSGVFISQVQYIKNKNCLVLDLGMNNNMRPSLYQAHHAFYNLNNHTQNKNNYKIVGPVCESSDIFHQNYELTTIQENDLLVMADCGAYVRSMASDYNLRPIAEEIFI